VQLNRVVEAYEKERIMVTNQPRLTQSIAHRLTQLAQLQGDLAEFEAQYALSSREFYPRYARGEMGDDMDFIEWAATLEMIANLNQQAALVTIHPTLTLPW